MAQLAGWYGMVWYGMVWYGMVWYGMADSGNGLWDTYTYTIIIVMGFGICRDDVHVWRRDPDRRLHIYIYIYTGYDSGLICQLIIQKK